MCSSVNTFDFFTSFSRYIFFTDWFRPAKILRAWGDGSNLLPIVNTTLGWPNGLAIDWGWVETIPNYCIPTYWGTHMRQYVKIWWSEETGTACPQVFRYFPIIDGQWGKVVECSKTIKTQTQPVSAGTKTNPFLNVLRKLLKEAEWYDLQEGQYGGDNAQTPLNIEEGFDEVEVMCNC